MDDRTLIVDFPRDAGIEFTGERYVPGIRGQIQYEHYHRYLAATPHIVDKDVLDVACGEGYGSFGLAQMAKHVCGVDIAAEVIAEASNRYQSSNLEFKTGSITAIPYPDASFDIVVCFETIEHVKEQDEAVAELRRVLRQDGMLLISSPNASAEDGAWHEGNPFHEKELTKQEFGDLLAPHFSHVRFAEQRFLHGSLLVEMGSLSEHDERTHFQTADGARYSAHRGDIGQSYFVAIASNVAAPSLGVTILDAEADFKALETSFREAVEYAHSLQAVQDGDPTHRQLQGQLVEKDRLLTAAQAELASTRAALEKLKSWRKLAELQIANLRIRANSNG